MSRISGPLDELKEPYFEAEEANWGKTKGKKIIEEVTTSQDQLPQEFSDKKDWWIIDEGANTNNMFSEKNLREILQEGRKHDQSYEKTKGRDSENKRRV